MAVQLGAKETPLCKQKIPNRHKPTHHQTEQVYSVHRKIVPGDGLLRSDCERDEHGEACGF